MTLIVCRHFCTTAFLHVGLSARVQRPYERFKVRQERKMDEATFVGRKKYSEYT